MPGSGGGNREVSSASRKRPQVEPNRLEHLPSAYGQAALAVPKSPRAATPSRIACALAHVLPQSGEHCAACPASTALKRAVLVLINAGEPSGRHHHSCC